MRRGETSPESSLRTAGQSLRWLGLLHPASVNVSHLAHAFPSAVDCLNGSGTVINSYHFTLLPTLTPYHIQHSVNKALHEDLHPSRRPEPHLPEPFTAPRRVETYITTSQLRGPIATLGVETRLGPVMREPEHS
jgi:hypothetical protein